MESEGGFVNRRNLQAPAKSAYRELQSATSMTHYPVFHSFHNERRENGALAWGLEELGHGDRTAWGDAGLEAL